MDIPGYRIVKQLGRGNMASVYLAVQESLDREVALKVMASNLVADPSFRERFLKEGKIIAQLSHPTIITVHDIGTSGHHYYMALEYAERGTLADRLKEGYSAEQILELLKQIASALSYAHQRGVIHRDVKPGNILFRANNSPVLSDFGIAKVLGANTQLTVDGRSIGTPTYMSPEQVRGVRTTAQSDLYSLGIIFFQMLTGRCPYESDDFFAIGYMHVNDPIPELPKEHAHYQSLVNRFLAKDPKDRLSSADVLIKEIDAVQSGRQQSKRHRPKPAKKNPLAANRQLLPVWLGALGLLAVIGSGIVFLTGGFKRAPSTTATQIEIRAPSDFVRARIPHLEEVAQAHNRLLMVQPDDKATIQGLQEIGDKFAKLARKSWDRADRELSLMVIERGLRVVPKHNGLLALKQEIKLNGNGKLNKAARLEIRRWLEEGQEYLAASRFIFPRGGSAVDNFRKVLQLDPGNKTALRRLNEMGDVFEKKARKRFDQGKVSEAVLLVEQGLSISPTHPGLRDLQTTRGSVPATHR